MPSWCRPCAKFPDDLEEFLANLPPPKFNPSTKLLSDDAKENSRAAISSDQYQEIPLQRSDVLQRSGCCVTCQFEKAVQRLPSRTQRAQSNSGVGSCGSSTAHVSKSQKLLLAHQFAAPDETAGCVLDWSILRFLVLQGNEGAEDDADCRAAQSDCQNPASSSMAAASDRQSTKLTPRAASSPGLENEPSATIAQDKAPSILYFDVVVPDIDIARDGPFTTVTVNSSGTLGMCYSSLHCIVFPLTSALTRPITRARVVRPQATRKTLDADGYSKASGLSTEQHDSHRPLIVQCEWHPTESAIFGILYEPEKSTTSRASACPGANGVPSINLPIGCKILDEAKSNQLHPPTTAAAYGYYDLSSGGGEDTEECRSSDILENSNLDESVDEAYNTGRWRRVSCVDEVGGSESCGNSTGGEVDSPISRDSIIRTIERRETKSEEVHLFGKRTSLTSGRGACSGSLVVYCMSMSERCVIRESQGRALRSGEREYGSVANMGTVEFNEAEAATTAIGFEFVVPAEEPMDVVHSYARQLGAGVSAFVLFSTGAIQSVALYPSLAKGRCGANQDENNSAIRAEQNYTSSAVVIAPSVTAGGAAANKATENGSDATDGYVSFCVLLYTPSLYLARMKKSGVVEFLGTDWTIQSHEALVNAAAGNVEDLQLEDESQLNSSILPMPPSSKLEGDYKAMILESLDLELPSRVASTTRLLYVPPMAPLGRPSILAYSPMALVAIDPQWTAKLIPRQSFASQGAPYTSEISSSATSCPAAGDSIAAFFGTEAPHNTLASIGETTGVLLPSTAHIIYPSETFQGASAGETPETNHEPPLFGDILVGVTASGSADGCGVMVDVISAEFFRSEEGNGEQDNDTSRGQEKNSWWGGLDEAGGEADLCDVWRAGSVVLERLLPTMRELEIRETKLKEAMSIMLASDPEAVLNMNPPRLRCGADLDNSTILGTSGLPNPLAKLSGQREARELVTGSSAAVEALLEIGDRLKAEVADLMNTAEIRKPTGGVKSELEETEDSPRIFTFKARPDLPIDSINDKLEASSLRLTELLGLRSHIEEIHNSLGGSATANMTLVSVIKQRQKLQQNSERLQCRSKKLKANAETLLARYKALIPDFKLLLDGQRLSTISDRLVPLFHQCNDDFITTLDQPLAVEVAASASAGERGGGRLVKALTEELIALDLESISQGHKGHGQRKPTAISRQILRSNMEGLVGDIRAVIALRHKIFKSRGNKSEKQLSGERTSGCLPAELQSEMASQGFKSVLQHKGRFGMKYKHDPRSKGLRKTVDGSPAERFS